MNLYYEPRKEALSKIVTKIENEPEMTEYESAFLCGLIREKAPKRILEIGIAGGGTSAIILQCIDSLGWSAKTELISLDLSESFYRDEKHKSGFLADEIKPYLSKDIKHSKFLGKPLPGYIKEIGGDIDLVVLDTVHFMPGEVLDFPVVLPFLSEEAIVVIHDVAYQYISSQEGFSCNALLASTVGKKIFPINDDKSTSLGFVNIAAVGVCEDTKKYIDSVFEAMMLPWTYLLDEELIMLYRDFYLEYYGDELTSIFDAAVKCNRELVSQKNIKHSFLNRFCRSVKILLNKSI